VLLLGGVGSGVGSGVGGVGGAVGPVRWGRWGRWGRELWGEVEVAPAFPEPAVCPGASTCGLVVTREKCAARHHLHPPNGGGCAELRTAACRVLFCYTLDRLVYARSPLTSAMMSLPPFVLVQGVPSGATPITVSAPRSGRIYHPQPSMHTSALCSHLMTSSGQQAPGMKISLMAY
jgi:hypothetical protein